MQDKSKEKKFFDTFANAGEYDVFTDRGYRSILKAYGKLLGTARSRASRVIDLGCGSGAFTRKFKGICERKTMIYGLDISLKSAGLAAKLSRGIHFCAGDIEKCCFPDASFDIVLFSGVLHHFKNYETCLSEGYRVLKRGGRVLSYDPNIKNPCMWLYRHPASPFFSARGKTENERLLSVEELARLLAKAGFNKIVTRCISGVTFRYVESAVGRFFLPLYNIFEILLGVSPLSSKYGSFVIGCGEKT